MKIKEWAEEDRPREKMLLKGIASLSDAELLAILIGSGNSRETAVQLSQRILTYIIHSGFISGYQNRYGDNLKPPTNVYHRMTA